MDCQEQRYLDLAFVLCYNFAMKLHLACGHRYIPGWMHVDLSEMPHINWSSPIDHLPFIHDGTVDIIYISHGLNYLEPSAVSQAFDEWWRVLKPNGVLRLSVPNLRASWTIYEKTNDISQLAGALYGRMHVKTPLGYRTVQHQAQYDTAVLNRLFTTHGFYNITYWDWRETEHANIDDYSQAYWPHMQKEDGTLLSINIQAQKYVR